MFLKQKIGKVGIDGNACFLWIYSQNEAGIKVFAQFRKDGLIGAPGGKVEEGESFSEALYREVFEETGINVEPYEEYIEALCTLTRIGSQKHSHAFTMKVSTDVLDSFLNDAVKRSGSHSDEACGYIVLPFDSWGTFHNVMGQNFAYSAKDELMELLKTLIGESVIDAWDKKVSKK